MSWEEYCAVVTGATGGIGNALCAELSKSGAELIVVARNEARLTQLEQILLGESSVQVVCGDLTQPATRTAVLTAVSRRRHGGIALFNNAGINRFGLFEQLPGETIESILQVDLIAPVVLTHSLLSEFRYSALPGMIVNIGSSFGAIGFPGFAAYSAAKFGLRGFSQALARELADSPVRVHHVAPRATLTTFNSTQVDQLNRELGNRADDPQWVARQILAAVASGRSEVFLGWPEKLFARLNGVLPGVVSKALRNKLNTIRHFSNSEHQPLEA